jgi:hypothetical protein
MGKTVGGPLAKAFFDDWKQRIQSTHAFPLAPAVKQQLKKEYQDWYLTIVRSGSAASSALANIDPSLPAVGGFFFSLCNACFASAAVCPL